MRDPGNEVVSPFLWITIFKDTLCLPQQLSLSTSIMKRCPLCVKKYSTESLRTVNNFVIARMADALAAFVLMQ